MEVNQDIPQLIRAWKSGDKAAEQELFDATYRVLHRIALHCLQAERDAGSMGPTALLHEAYLRFAKTTNLSIANNGHFLALVSRVMRRIIVDRARARQSEKAGGKYMFEPVDSSLNVAVSERDIDEIIGVDLALRALAERCPRQAQVVELRYFGGFTEEETAAIMGVSIDTVKFDWKVARLRLKLAINGAADV